MLGRISGVRDAANRLSKQSAALVAALVPRSPRQNTQNIHYRPLGDGSIPIADGELQKFPTSAERPGVGCSLKRDVPEYSLLDTYRPEADHQEFTRIRSNTNAAVLPSLGFPVFA